MSSRLTRRALFALPVALPVAAAVGAAVAAAVAPKAPVYRRLSGKLVDRPFPFTLEPAPPFKVIKTVGTPWASSGGYDEIRETLFDSGWLPARPMPTKFTDDELAATLGIDAGGNDNKVAVAVARPAQPVVA